MSDKHDAPFCKNHRPLRGPQPQDDDMNKFLEAFHALLIFSVVLFFWVIA